MCAKSFKRAGTLAGNAIVATVMSNIDVEVALRDAGIGIVRCPVCDKYVMEKMLEDKDLVAAMLGWGQSWDSDPSQIWHSESARSAKGSNFVSYMNPHLDDVIEGLKTTFDMEKRQELWRDFQRTIVADQPYCFTFIRTRAWFIHNRLGNHYFNKLRPQDWFLPWYVKDGK